MSGMKRLDYISGCADYLGRLVHEIKLRSSLSLYDINKVSEDFFIPILKILYNCPDLCNQNQIEYNYPAVDLGCRTSRTSFQVTSDASSEKVAKTLEKFAAHKLQEHFDKLFVLVIIQKQSTYGAKTVEEKRKALKIEFDPTTDVIDSTDLLKKLEKAETPHLEAIFQYLRSQFEEQDRNLRFKNTLKDFLEFGRRKLDVEKQSKKYIPSIFVETHEAKEDVRIFANPIFFHGKIHDAIAGVRYRHLNNALEFIAGPPFQSILDAISTSDSPTSLAELRGVLRHQRDVLSKEIDALSFFHDRSRQDRFRTSEKQKARWDIKKNRIRGSASYNAKKLEAAVRLIDLSEKKIFLVTGMAGQGKTNFVCDLVDNQFRLFEIPSIFIPARELNTHPAGARILSFISSSRYAPPTANLFQVLELFQEIAEEMSRPFVFVIDGLNEVNDLGGFNNELRLFLNAVTEFETVKVILTCRSEFFSQKFSSILNEPFATSIHHISDLKSQMSHAAKERLLSSYLTHFKITADLSPQAHEFLQNDLLLLRIFCEINENSNIGFISTIYKGRLFMEYLAKIVDGFSEPEQIQVSGALNALAAELLAAEDSSQVSVRKFTKEHSDVIRRFVAEDVLLRQELPKEGLSSLGDFVVSFTYDELRDFIIANYLVESIASSSTDELGSILASIREKPIYEGVFRYVYAIARQLNKRAIEEECERAPDFLLHYANNLELLPADKQSTKDVERVKHLLEQVDTIDLVLGSAWFLYRARDPDLPLHIGILTDHLSSLEDDTHRRFLGAMFALQNEWGYSDWEEHLNSYVEHALDRNPVEFDDFNCQVKVFVLHIIAYAHRGNIQLIERFLERLSTSVDGRALLSGMAECRSEQVRAYLNGSYVLEGIEI